MGFREDARTWAKANLGPAQFEQFMDAVGEKRKKHYYASANFEYVPPDLASADTSTIKNKIEAALRNNMTPEELTGLNINVTARETY